jgi:hypothetical protein
MSRRLGRIALVATGAITSAMLSIPRDAGANSCKAHLAQCATNVSCCSGHCVKPTLSHGVALFGECCTPTTCQAAGANCGTIPDGDCTGFTLNCGTTCPAGQSCGGGGTPNVCGTSTTTTATTTSTTTTTACVPKVCDISQIFGVCGTLDDGCGGTIFCQCGICFCTCTDGTTESRLDIGTCGVDFCPDNACFASDTDCSAACATIGQSFANSGGCELCSP